MTKHIYLHIGLHKTGTTSLQVFLHTNASKLQGFYYPESGRPSKEGIRYGHHDLPWSLRRKDNDPETVWGALLREIDSTSADRIILSSEEFDTLNRGDISKVKEYLSEYTTTVVVYLRRQDELAQAKYSTVVKNGKVSIPFDIFLKRIRTKLDFHNFLKDWADIFGKENIRVRVYSKVRLIAGDTINDFCEQIGLTWPEDQITSARKINRGLPRNVIEILRKMNEMGIPRKCRVDLVGIAAKLYPRHDYYDILSPTNAKRLVDDFKESNHMVMKEYINEAYDKLFPESFDYITDERWNELYAISHAEIQKTISDLKLFVSSRDFSRTIG